MRKVSSQSPIRIEHTTHTTNGGTTRNTPSDTCVRRKRRGREKRGREGGRRVRTRGRRREEEGGGREGKKKGE